LEISEQETLTKTPSAKNIPSGNIPQSRERSKSPDRNVFEYEEGAAGPGTEDWQGFRPSTIT